MNSPKELKIINKMLLKLEGLQAAGDIPQADTTEN